MLLAGGFLLSALVGGWVQVRPHLADLEWRYALLGQLFALLAFLLGGVVWHTTQRSFGIRANLANLQHADLVGQRLTRDRHESFCLRYSTCL